MILKVRMVDWIKVDRHKPELGTIMAAAPKLGRGRSCLGTRLCGPRQKIADRRPELLIVEIRADRRAYPGGVRQLELIET
jgi:hypothetical protein